MCRRRFGSSAAADSTVLKKNSLWLRLLLQFCFQGRTLSLNFTENVDQKSLKCSDKNLQLQRGDSVRRRPHDCTFVSNHTTFATARSFKSPRLFLFQDPRILVWETFWGRRTRLEASVAEQSDTDEAFLNRLSAGGFRFTDLQLHIQQSSAQMTTNVFSGSFYPQCSRAVC